METLGPSVNHFRGTLDEYRHRKMLERGSVKVEAMGRVPTALRREDEARRMPEAALKIVREVGDVPGEQDTQAALDRLDELVAGTKGPNQP